MNKVNGVNNLFFSEKNIIEILFQKLGLDWHIFRNGYC